MTRIFIALTLLATPAFADCNPEWCGPRDTNNPLADHQFASGNDPADVGPAPADPPAPAEPAEPSDPGPSEPTDPGVCE